MNAQYLTPKKITRLKNAIESSTFAQLDSALKTSPYAATTVLRSFDDFTMLQLAEIYPLFITEQKTEISAKEMIENYIENVYKIHVESVRNIGKNFDEFRAKMNALKNDSIESIQAK